MRDDYLSVLYKYRGEIETLKEQVNELSWDEPFGMLTRPAFIRYCRQRSAGNLPVVFVDLDDVGELNRNLGYKEVDRRVRILSERIRKSGNIIARWFSGDEIVILVINGLAEEVLKRELQSAAQSVGLCFVSVYGMWAPEMEKIEDVVEQLSTRSLAMKKGTR